MKILHPPKKRGKWENLKFLEKKIGSDNDTEIGPWFRFPIPKPGFSRILGHVCMHVGITLLLVCAFFTVRHEKFAIVVKCKWGKINLKQTSVSQNYNQNSITLIWKCWIWFNALSFSRAKWIWDRTKMFWSSPKWTFPNLIFLFSPKFGKSPNIELNWS